MVSMVNPWAVSKTADEFAEPDYPPQESGRFAVPNLDQDAPYNDEFGWSAPLRLSAQETPDLARLGQRPLRDFRPDPNKPPEEGFYADRDKDEALRHSSEDIDANGWDEKKGIVAGENRWAPNPRSTPVAESRLTQQLSPRSYSFLRPFGHGQPKSTPDRFNGEHFSMADHRRTYEIGGMAPASSRRNTYRVEPTPWDADVVDVPPNTDAGLPNGRIQAVEVAYNSRNWRL